MNNSLLKDQLNKSIKLANLKLVPKEKDSLLVDLSKILHFVSLIKQSEKKGEAKFGKNLEAQAKEYPQTKKSNILRSDIIAPFSNLKGMFSTIPQKKNNLIKVKKI
jgi:aspartyl/glutamyl-tRNA(Asn/Gln) amidotransferase C subunit